MIRNESNLEQHKKICISQKKERNKKKTAEKQIENRRFLTENSQRINKTIDNTKSIDEILRHKTQNPVYNIQTLVKLHKKQMFSLGTKLKICEIELKCLKSTKND